LDYCQNHQIRIRRRGTTFNSGCTVVTRGKIKRRKGTGRIYCLELQ